MDLLHSWSYGCACPHVMRERPMLSPRFLVLPVIALTVIVALSQTRAGASTSEAAPSVLRAGTCALPAASFEAGCALADSQTVIVR